MPALRCTFVPPPATRQIACWVTRLLPSWLCNTTQDDTVLPRKCSRARASYTTRVGVGANRHAGGLHAASWCHLAAACTRRTTWMRCVAVSHHASAHFDSPVFAAGICAKCAHHWHCFTSSDAWGGFADDRVKKVAVSVDLMKEEQATLLFADSHTLAALPSLDGPSTCPHSYVLSIACRNLTCCHQSIVCNADRRRVACSSWWRCEGWLRK